MKTFELILIWLVIGILNVNGASKTIQPNDTLIEYSGRIDFSNPLSPCFSYSGVSIRADFDGTAISAVLKDEKGENYYNIILDRTEIHKIKLDLGEKTYVLAENLKDTVHEIEIFRVTEEMFGKTNFLGFSIDESDSLVEISRKRELLFEFIGNSISCGYGIEGVSGGTFGASTENHYFSFAAIASRTFNARHLAVCKSGIGITRNYNEPPSGTSMPNYYERIYLSDATPKYSFAETPDLICINLGTNDFSTAGGDSSLFVHTYLQFIDSIQSYYSSPDIVCLTGSMLGGTELINIRKYLGFVADSANNKGKGNVWFFEMTQQQGDLGIAIDGHPTVAQQMKNSRELIKFISSIKGLEINPLLVRAELMPAAIITLEFNTGIYDNSNNYSGLQVFADNNRIDIDSVYKNETDSFKLIIKLSDPLNFGQDVKVKYTSGQIMSSEGVMLEPFEIFLVNNKLSETKISSGKVSSNGTTISLIFNKSMALPESLDDITISSNRGTIGLKSITLSFTTLKIVIDNEIYKDDTVVVSYSGQSILGADGVSCTAFTDLLLNNQSSVTSSAIVDKEIKKQVLFYPNPVISNTLNYNIQQQDVIFPVALSVFNSEGKTVYRGTLNSSQGSIQIDRQLLRNSTYIIHLESRNYLSDFKIIY